MAVQDGLYRVTFGTPLGSGYGVAFLSGGKVRGGDTMMAYAGDYASNGDNFTATVHVFKHSDVPDTSSVLGTDDANLNISGSITGDTIQATGTSPQAPGVNLLVHLERLQD